MLPIKAGWPPGPPGPPAGQHEVPVPDPDQFISIATVNAFAHALKFRDQGAKKRVATRGAVLSAMKCRPCGSGFQPRSSRQDAAPTEKQLHWKSNFGVALHRVVTAAYDEYAS